MQIHDTINLSPNTTDIETGSNIPQNNNVNNILLHYSIINKHILIVLENRVNTIETDLQTLQKDYKNYKWYYNWLISFMETLILVLFLKTYNII